MAFELRPRALALLCLLCCACSTQGSGSPNGATPSLGLLPLRASPLQVCRANRSLGVLEASGFCVGVDEVPSSCVGGCGAREACVCERCRMLACAASSECGAGEQCRRGRCERTCASQVECGAGERCEGGGCVARCSAGCRAGERCENELCQAARCRLDGDCAGGQRCELVRERAVLVEPSVVRGESGFECAVEERRTEGSRILTGVVRGERLVLDAAPFAASMAWEAGSVGTPALARVEGRMTLFYEGGVAGGIGRATRGPAGFERESSPVLVARETFEEGRVGAPAVGEGVLLYEAGRAATDAGNVCSRDAECGGALQRCRGGRCRAMPRVIGQVALAALGGPRTVALDPERVRSGDAGREDGTPLWGDLQGVGSPGVVGLTTREGEHITLLFFTGIGRERADVALNPSLGLALGVSSASAPATLRGYPYNPVLGESVLFTSPVGESGASPFLLDGASTPGSAASLRVVFERIEPNGAPGGLRIARPER